MAISTEDSVDENGMPNGVDAVFYNDLEIFEKLFDSLTHSTEYFCWVRAKNIISESVWSKLSATTDVPLTAEILGFSVTSPDFESIVGSWNKIEDREYFHSFSLSEGSNTENIRTKSKSTGFNKKRLKPNTEYSYVYTVHNEFDRVLFSASGKITTHALPVPSKTVSVSGTRLNCEIEIPIGIKKVRLEDATKNTTNPDGSFDDKNTVSNNIERSVGSDLSTIETKNIMISRDPSKEYFLHC